jgi:hypothetical protein
MKKVIYTIFAGRKRYLEIQKKYIDTLLHLKLINEVHLWEYTRTKEDENYIIDLCNMNNKYKLFRPNNKVAWNWKDYYHYYSENIEDDTILIKCDDDVVYIDINNFSKFIESVNDDVLYFPNIINNDVGAYYQVKNGIHNLLNEKEMEEFSKKNLVSGNGNPMTEWYTLFEKADKIHELFLSNDQLFHLNNQNLIEHGNRISINFFAANSIAVRKYYSEFAKSNIRDDEHFLSIKPNEFGKINKINLNFTVVHFQFGPQNGKLLDEKYLEKYNLLTNKLNQLYI